MRISDWSSDVCSSDLIPGRDLLVRLQAQAAHYDVQVRPDTVDELRQDQDGGFTAVIGPEGVRATMVLLATGVVDRQPDNAALTDLRIATLAGVVRWCPICDGFEVLDQEVGVIAPADSGVEHALFLISEEHTSELQSLIRIS